ncbi:MAG TPA: histidine kinase [Bacteroidales bacterium]|jgi:two-component system, LytTR family, sensor kinase|nr:histidine kinase [Bacteroidales bacterium]HBZ21987.1 histidine kinase [Bacteroidales bacterium]
MKHPVLSNRVRLIVWWLAWFFITAGQLLLYYYSYGSFSVSAIPDGIVSMAIYSGIGLSLWYPFRYFNAAKSRSLSEIANLVFSGALSVVLWVVITKYFVQAILPKVNDYPAYWEATFPYRVGTGVFMYGLIILAYYLFVSLYNLSEKNVKEAKLESLVKETELKMLRSQINPHFLFNSLNSVSSLTITNPEKARDMVIKLSEFMRYALSKKDEQPVTLRSELENLRLYLEIEKVRFGDRLFTEESISEKCLDIKMPVMILQPLYENAIKHGVYESTESVNIRTKVSCNNGYLEIVISNNYDQTTTSAKGTGTGLINVSRRLDLFFGNRASIRSTKENGIYTVSLFIPAEV